MRNIFSACNPKGKFSNSVRYVTSKSAMKIRTFVFLDCETTGLPYEEGNATKITELCLAAVQSDHINLGVFPRVLNKLSVCFNPRKMIAPMSTQITGLANDLLEFQPEFQDETFKMIRAFLGLLRKPICFVAHNGDYFDYPILRTEIHKTGNELPDDVLCVDSLQAFRELDRRETQQADVSVHDLPTQRGADEPKNIHDLPTQRNERRDVPYEFCDGYDELLISVADEVEGRLGRKSVAEVQAVNETTPRKKAEQVRVVADNSTNGKCENIDGAYYLPPENGTRSLSDVQRDNSTSSQRSKLPPVRKQLHFGRPSFKLSDVYTRLTGKEPAGAHRAEEDVSMLIGCAATSGQDFTNWANANAKKFCDVPMMRPGKRVGW